jgi:hypothetical protein
VSVKNTKHKAQKVISCIVLHRRFVNFHITITDINAFATPQQTPSLDNYPGRRCIPPHSSLLLVSLIESPSYSSGTLGSLTPIQTKSSSSSSLYNDDGRRNHHPNNPPTAPPLPLHLDNMLLHLRSLTNRYTHRI